MNSANVGNIGKLYFKYAIVGNGTSNGGFLLLSQTDLVGYYFVPSAYTGNDAANNASISAVHDGMESLNDYCSARGRAKFIADWLPGGRTIARTLWGSNNGAQLGFYQLSARDLNNITGENHAGQTIALHAASEGLKVAARSTAFLTWLRGATEAPKSVAGPSLVWLAWGLIAADAGSGFYKEGKEILSCQAGD